jgi:hypothetical protein
MKSPFQLEIPRRSPQCALGLEPLTVGMEYYSVLFLEEKGYRRQDFCLACWEAKAREESLKSSKSYWKSKVYDKKEVTQPPLNKDERAFELFMESLKKEDEEARIETFILALYLARRKILYLRQDLTDQAGRRLQLYEVAKTEEMLTVLRVELSTIQMEKVQLELAKKFKAHG